MNFITMLVTTLYTYFEHFATMMCHGVLLMLIGVCIFVHYLAPDRVRKSETNAPSTLASTYTQTPEPITLIRAEIEKMKLQTRLLEAELREIENIHLEAETGLADEANQFEDLIQRYKYVHLNHIQRNANERQSVIEFLQDAYDQTQHQLTAAQCAEREASILRSRRDQSMAKNRF